jgi:PAS domain S-box-containing protein
MKTVKSNYSDFFREQFIATLDQTDEFVWTLDVNLNIINYNKAFYEWFSKLVGLENIQYTSIVNPVLGNSVTDDWKRYIAETITAGAPQIFKIVNDNPQKGMSEYSETQIRPIYNERGELYRFFVRSRDLSASFNIQRDLQRANEELLRSMDLYRTLATQIPNFGVVIFDKDYRYLLCEGTALAAVGLSKEHYEGRTMLEAMSEEGIKALRPQYDAALNGEYLSFEYQALNRQYHAQIVPIKDSNGQVFRGMILVNDVTDIKIAEQVLANTNKVLEEEVLARTSELKSTNQELREINQYLDDFVHAAAHDLRSPIVNLKTILHLLETIGDKQEREGLIAILPSLVQDIGNTLDGMIRMVEFQKKDQLLVSLLSFNDVFSNALKVFEYSNEIQLAEIDFDFSKADSIWYIAPKLQSLFYNLLSNALKYASPKRNLKLRVTSHREGELVRLDFLDNGIGIDLDQHRNNLFKPFRRFASEGITGTGLGLSLVKSMVEKNGGSIEVESVIDEYTLFKIRLVPYPQ